MELIIVTDDFCTYPTFILDVDLRSATTDVENDSQFYDWLKILDGVRIHVGIWTNMRTELGSGPIGEEVRI